MNFYNSLLNLSLGNVSSSTLDDNRVIAAPSSHSRVPDSPSQASTATPNSSCFKGTQSDPAKIALAQAYLLKQFGVVYDRAKHYGGPIGMLFPDNKSEYMEMINHGINSHLEAFKDQIGAGEDEVTS